jgi:hypothetical protein
VAYVNLFVDGFCILRFLLQISGFCTDCFIHSAERVLPCGLDLVIDLVDGAGFNAVFLFSLLWT